ncbi:hypothetical protein DL95DRAFT_396956 [Leptodontidium sp. 2 PMI_412]|nr:hypothetical protein DL95DRAFT_396956 [Leptodontidium sp. 2 PMI_412]
MSTPTPAPTSTGTGTGGKKKVHLTILIQKLDTIPHEGFYRYWTIEHPRIWLSVPIVRENVLKYVSLPPLTTLTLYLTPSPYSSCYSLTTSFPPLLVKRM